jgi:hypothetical protein
MNARIPIARDTPIAEVRRRCRRRRELTVSVKRFTIPGDRRYGKGIALTSLPMIDLYNATTNQLIGSITETDLKVLMDHLEEESADDQDYYIDQPTVDFMADGQATEHLLQLLRAAVGSSEGIEIRWQRR